MPYSTNSILFSEYIKSSPYGYTSTLEMFRSWSLDFSGIVFIFEIDENNEKQGGKKCVNSQTEKYPLKTCPQIS